MAGPPRFTSMPMGNGFRMNFGGPPPSLIGMPMRPPGANLAPSAGGGGPPKNSQVTTVFVGNISEKADNEFVKQMLEMCGTVVAWKRMAGVSGKLQGFGFCDFEEPEDTLRALRVLNEFQLGDKKLIVKVEQKHRDQLKAFAEKEAGVPAKPNSEELPASEKALRKDENVRLKILEAIEKDYPELVKFEDGELDDKEKDSKAKDAKKDVDESKDRKDRRSKRSRSRSNSRSRSPARRDRRRSRSPRNKRRRRSSRSSSRSSSDSRSSRSSSRSSSYDSRDRKRRSRRSRSTSRATYEKGASDDSEDAREKRAIKRQIKEKEMAYAARLKEWEGREKKMSKKYEKDENREKNRKLDVNKEAKKLKAFLEDYDDEKDDPKYYKSSSLFGRRREFEREKGQDERDRLAEQAEIEELKRQIVEESKAKAKQEEMETREVEEEARRRHEQKEAAARAKHQRDGSGSPNPHQPLGQRRRGDGGSSSSESGSDDDEEKAEDENNVVKEGQKWSTFGATDSPAASGVTSSPAGGASASPSLGASATRSPLITAAPIRLNTLKQSAASVFGGEEDEEVLMARKKLKPFEITQEERIKTMTTGEIKKLQKEIADTIPADKDSLFEFDVKRDYLTRGDAMGRVKSWVAKKIKEYIGEEDQSLIQFICEKVTSGASPARIQDDLAMIIDNEAAAFTIKLWRLVIYETECASRGLPQATAGR